MNLVVALLTGMLLAIPTAEVSAQPTDCDADRCLIQATIDAECPCAEAKNQGRYRTCVKRVINRAASQGIIDKRCRSKIKGCFIRTTCGRRDGAVTCQLPGGLNRCRPLSSADQCTSRGGLIVESCCETCGGPEPTATPTDLPTPTATDVPVETPTATEPPLQTATPTPQPTAEPTEQPTTTATPVDAPTATATPIDAPTATATPVDAPTATATPIDASTATATPVDAPTATATPIDAPTATATPVDAPTATATPIDAPTATATPVDAPTATATPVDAPTATATPVDEPTATLTPVVTATATLTPVVTATPTVTATATLNPTPTATATSVPEGFCSPAGADVCPNAGNGLEICSMQNTCNCPTRVAFVGDPASPSTILDTGWNGIAHRAPVISNGDVTVALSNCTLGPTRPDCGTCTVSGPIPNTEPGQLQNQRCTGDLSVKCTNAPGGTGGPCAGLGTCEFWFGAPLPLVAGGVGTCVLNQFNGPVSGTANVETGEATTVANLISRVYSAIATDNPCPRCIGDATPNDGGATTGTCSGGPRNTGACDANGTVPGRPDFGSTSLDCQPDLAGIIATLPIDLTNSTGVVSKEITAESPNCSGTGATPTKCACDTCNTALAQPCDSNADCPLASNGTAGICGGRRCLGGTNDGGPCGGSGGGASACPGGGTCGRPGEPTKPNACVDNTTTPAIDGSLCVDAAPFGDNEGECPEGPPTGVCSLASGHAQRSCTSNNDCCDDPPLCNADPPVMGDCQISNRKCFLDNGLGGSIDADGEADVPMNDVANPTLAAVFCIAPTSAPAVNAAAGLPGPGKVTIQGEARGLP